MKTVTCIVKDDDYTPTANPLVYTVSVNNPNDEAEVKAAVEEARSHDVDGEVSITLLFCFAGDLSPLVDWRE